MTSSSQVRLFPRRRCFVHREAGVDDLDKYLEAWPTRAVLSVLGLAAMGVLFALGLAFGMCVPGGLLVEPHHRLGIRSGGRPMPRWRRPPRDAE